MLTLMSPNRGEYRYVHFNDHDHQRVHQIMGHVQKRLYPFKTQTMLAIQGRQKFHRRLSAAFRPVLFLTEHLHLAAEGNIQYLRPNGVSWEPQKHDYLVSLTQTIRIRALIKN